MKRVLLFVATNIAVLAVISIAFQIFGFEGLLQSNGVDLNLQALLLMSAIIGFLGSFVSLALSKFMAKRTTGARVITQPSSDLEQWLVSTVARQANAAGINAPEVAIYDAPDVNAFATGARRNSALVAVSTGLLHSMTRDEAEAVLAHEISHVANGDMVTMTLVQGVVNTFVIFLSRLVGFFVDRVLLRNERGLGIGYFVSSIAAQILFGILASMIVMWFSRYREFRADAGGANLAGRQKMIAALERLKQGPQQDLPGQLAGFGIGGGKSRFGKLFMSHPPLDERIHALRSSFATS
ncbi:MAG: protease HtpX [Gammaproteobacteria bacterium]|nr:protease HtpX [Gammaproteobacteria bacterium]